MRVEKTFDGGVYKYYLDGSKIIREDMCFDDDIYTFKYYYDIDGSPISFDYNGTLYILRKNLQGDVIQLLDKYGNVIANYTYDAWGKLCKITDASGNEITDIGHIANINPFRYRGYYYDIDMGLYYLNSRYYDPELGRFLNGDGYVTTGQGLLSYNMYAYCGNNPIIRIDISGSAWETVFDLFSLGVSVVEVFVNPADPTAWIGLAGDTIDLIPFVTGVGELTRAAKTADKVYDTVKITKAVDFADDAIDTLKVIDRSSGFTKSSAKNGIKIHKGYKTSSIFEEQAKECRYLKGMRPDYVDINNKTVYELKPGNPDALKRGIKQVLGYSEALEEKFSMKFNKVIELY